MDERTAKLNALDEDVDQLRDEPGGLDEDAARLFRNIREMRDDPDSNLARRREAEVDGRAAR
jgi:hypothetical protein